MVYPDPKLAMVIEAMPPAPSSTMSTVTPVPVPPVVDNPPAVVYPVPATTLLPVATRPVAPTVITSLAV